MGGIYKIVDDFQAADTDIRVLVFDHDYGLTAPKSRGVAVIDGKEYEYMPNGILRWVTIHSREQFTGKTVQFCKKAAQYRKHDANASCCFYVHGAPRGCGEK